MGSIRTAIDIIPIIPQELLIKERLAVTVRRDSFIDEPTKGTKLLIANLAVFTEIESTLCAMVFLYERTNINIDITNTVTDVKVVFTVLEIPLKSSSPLKERAQPNAKEMLVSGTIKDSKKFSTILMNSSIEPFETTAADRLPSIVNKDIIMGKNALIILQRIFIYSRAFEAKPPHMLNTVIEMQRLEQSEKTKLIPLSEMLALNALKIEIRIINTRTETKLFNTKPIPDVK